MIPRKWLVSCHRRRASAEAHQSVSDPRGSPVSHGPSNARSSSWRAAARSASWIKSWSSSSVVQLDCVSQTSHSARSLLMSSTASQLG